MQNNIPFEKLHKFYAWMILITMACACLVLVYTQYLTKLDISESASPNPLSWLIPSMTRNSGTFMQGQGKRYNGMHWLLTVTTEGKLCNTITHTNLLCDIYDAKYYYRKCGSHIHSGLCRLLGDICWHMCIPASPWKGIAIWNLVQTDTTLLYQTDSIGLLFHHIHL